jgi:ribosomal protein S18 acetylase RimI-like enzyme
MMSLPAIRVVTPDDYEPVRAFLCAHGWAQRVPDPATFARLLDNSQRKLVALHEGAVIGFVRGITDDISNGYISMLAVAPEFRRQGLGRRLVDAVIGDNRDVTWVLRAGREGAIQFFERAGFVASTCAMERMRGG